MAAVTELAPDGGKKFAHKENIQRDDDPYPCPNPFPQLFRHNLTPSFEFSGSLDELI